MKDRNKLWRVVVCVNEFASYFVDATESRYHHFVNTVQYKRLLCNEYDDMFIFYLLCDSRDDAIIEGMRKYFCVMNNEHTFYPHLRTTCVDDGIWHHYPKYDLDSGEIVLHGDERLLYDFERRFSYKKV